jgi:hypothetical protein
MIIALLRDDRGIIVNLRTSAAIAIISAANIALSVSLASASVPHAPMASFQNPPTEVYGPRESYGPHSTPSPSWSSKIANLRGNESYFVQTRISPTENLSTDIFRNERSNLEIRNQVEREFDSYETRRNSGLAEATDEKSYFERMKNLTRSAMNGLGRLHAKASTSHLKNFAETDLKDVRTPLAGAVLAAALYRGKAFGFRLAEDVRVESHTALKNKESSVSMVIPGLTSSIYYTQENNLSAKVSKHVVDNISAEIDTASRGTLQLKYGVTF